MGRKRTGHFMSEKNLDLPKLLGGTVGRLAPSTTEVPVSPFTLKH